MEEPSIATDVARNLYATYCASNDKHRQGLPCPSWEVLTEATRDRWRAIASRIRLFASAARVALGKSPRERRGSMRRKAWS